jgi:hypothetical protein
VIRIREEDNEPTIAPSNNNHQELEGDATREEIEEGETITERVLEGQESNYLPL